MKGLCVWMCVVWAACGVEISLTRTKGVVTRTVKDLEDVHIGTVRIGVRKPDVPLMMLDALTYTDISIGSEGKTLRVMIDSGSSTLAVPGQTCNFKRCVTCFYSSATSTSARDLACPSTTCKMQRCSKQGTCPFKVFYADKTGENGTIVSDTITLGAFTAEGVLFGKMTGEYGTEASAYKSLGVDGILGIAGKRLNFIPMNEPTLIDVIIEQYKLPNLLGISVGVQGKEGSGTLTIGSINDARYQGDLKWTMMNAEAFYVVRPRCLSVESTVVADTEDSFGRLTIVDTGTTYTFLPGPVYMEIVSVLSTKYSHLPFVDPTAEQSIFKPGMCFTIKVTMFPVLHFTFVDGVVASVPPENYFIQAHQHGLTYNCFGIAPSDDGSYTFNEPSQTILGDSFMSAFYIVFNRDNSSMGIAPAKGTREVPTTSGVCALGKLVIPAPSNALPYISFACLGVGLLYKICFRRKHHSVPMASQAHHKSYGAC